MLCIAITCDRSTGAVVIKHTAYGYLVENNSESDIAFYAVDRERSTSIIWKPACADEDILYKGTFVEMSYATVVGYASNRPFIVYYWNCPYKENDPISSETLHPK